MGMSEPVVREAVREAIDLRSLLGRLRGSRDAVPIPVALEIAASIAPKPLLLISDGEDWTKNTPRVEFPYVQRVYRLLGAEANVERRTEISLPSNAVSAGPVPL